MSHYELQLVIDSAANDNELDEERRVVQAELTALDDVVRAAQISVGNAPGGCSLRGVVGAWRYRYRPEASGLLTARFSDHRLAGLHDVDSAR